MLTAKFGNSMSSTLRREDDELPLIERRSLRGLVGEVCASKGLCSPFSYMEKDLGVVGDA